jgi:RNA polymerase sigma-70 factor (ECF subfamily)
LFVNAPRAVGSTGVEESEFAFETIFRVHYERIARVIARVVGDPGRAEELAVEVLLKLWRNPAAHGEKAGGWLYRSAVRVALDELRKQARRARYERFIPFALPPHAFALPPRNPEEAHAASEEQTQVRRVLAALGSRDAGLLLLRSDGLSYEEIASALELNPASTGTLLSRAQQAFRKEYERRYGKPDGIRRNR